MNFEITEKLKSKFKEVYGREHQGAYFAPGRVNLIGEHTDYNGGHVFPCALPAGTYGMIAPREDRLLRFFSLNMPESGITSVELDELAPGRTDGWTSYPEGVFWAAKKEGFDIPFGADILFAGDIPAGSGLSSSASIEVLTGLMIKETYGLEELTLERIALISQRGENVYCGMQCGIMDQFASAMGKEGHAIYLDTATMEYELVPLELGEREIIITNSKVKHLLVSSAYNDRRRECAKALEDIRKVPALADTENLCSIGEENFERYQAAISDPVCRDRAEHAVREEARTGSAVAALRGNDIETFGRLMNESHISLRDRYQVSCPEIDFLTELAWEIPGVLGSRMTGGGFGGCTISIVAKESVDGFISRISREYEKAFDIKPEFYRARPQGGARKLDV